MSAVSIARPGTSHDTATRPGWKPASFARLASVELRKQLDTRAGVWLLIVIVLVNAAIIALTLGTSEPAELTWEELSKAGSVGQLVLLPLVGILAATSEWSQRTALTTFVLEPRRTRVTLAKVVSSVVLGLVVMVGSVAFAAALNVLGMALRDGDGSWAMDPAVLGGNALALTFLAVQGVAFGLALLSTPTAIVAYLTLPTVWTVLGMFIGGLEDTAAWLNLNATLQPLIAGDLTGEDWSRLGVSALVWIAVPLAIGLWRTGRRDVN